MVCVDVVGGYVGCFDSPLKGMGMYVWIMGYHSWGICRRGGDANGGSTSIEHGV